MKAAREHPWGVYDSAFDTGALRDGRLVLRSFSGVFPDGTVVAFVDGDDASPPSRSLEGLFPTTAVSLPVHLAVPEARRGARHVVGAGEPGRLTASRRELGDEHGEGAAIEVETGRLALRLRVHDESRDGLSTLKIAEIVRDDGGFALSPDFVPPVLRLAAAPALRRALEGLVTLVHERRAALREGLACRDGMRDLSSLSVTQRHLYVALSEHAPVLVEPARRPERSSEAVHDALCRFAGHLSSVSADEEVGLPAYDHSDLRATFSGVLTRIRALLGVAVRPSCVVVPLAQTRGVWAGRLEEPRLRRCRGFVLGVRVAPEIRDRVGDLPRGSKVASWRRFNAIARLAARGASLSPRVQAPPEVPAHPGEYFFKISRDQEHWVDALSERTVAVYLPPPFDPERVQVTLYGLPEAVA